MFSLTVQTYMMAVDVALGIILGFLFDVFRALRRVLDGGPTRRPWLDALLDAAFWAIALPLVVLAWGLGNWGQVRAFTLLGLALGLGLYAGLGSPVLLPALTATYRSVGGGVIRLGRGTRRAAGALARAVRRGMAGLRTLVGWLLMPVTRPLRWLLAPLLAPVHRALIAPVAARLRRFVLGPWRRGVPSRRRIAAAWRRWRAAMAAWLGPGKGEPPPPRS